MADSGHKNTEEKTNWKKELMEWLIVIEVAVVFAVILNMFIIVNASIPNAIASMDCALIHHSTI